METGELSWPPWHSHNRMRPKEHWRHTRINTLERGYLELPESSYDQATTLTTPLVLPIRRSVYRRVITFEAWTSGALTRKNTAAFGIVHQPQRASEHPVHVSSGLVQEQVRRPPWRGDSVQSAPLNWGTLHERILTRTHSLKAPTKVVNRNQAILVIVTNIWQ